jgi:RimJ/RimL family protein N-acetyltransferase
MRFDRLMTPRLLLRRWQPEDLDPFAALNADPEVMQHFPSTYDRAVTASMIAVWEAKIDRQGFGLWAVERSEDGVLLGMAGLNPVPPGIIAGDGLEVGWRLARHAWGYGYATEAGRAAVDVARRIGVPSVWSFTSLGNHRSQAVMRRLGLGFVRNFDHPNIPDGDPTRAHVLYMLDLAKLESNSEGRDASQ